MEAAREPARAGRAAGNRGDGEVLVHATDAGSIRVVTRDPLHVAKRATVGFRWGGDSEFTMAQVPGDVGGCLHSRARPARRDDAPRLLRPGLRRSRQRGVRVREPDEPEEHDRRGHANRRGRSAGRARVGLREPHLLDDHRGCPRGRGDGDLLRDPQSDRRDPSADRVDAHAVSFLRRNGRTPATMLH